MQRLTAVGIYDRDLPSAVRRCWPCTGRRRTAAHYAAINAHDYATAWSRGGSCFVGSYNTFVADYA